MKHIKRIDELNINRMLTKGKEILNFSKIRENNKIIKSIIDKLELKSKEELLDLRNKLYSVNESFEQSSYFSKIDMTTFIREVDNYNGPYNGHQEWSWNLGSMTVRDIEYLKKVCDSLGLKNWATQSRFSFWVTINSKQLYIYKSIDDEWFYVSNTHVHELKLTYPSDFEGYKCDQLDGVAYLIKSLSLNKDINESIQHDEKLCKYLTDDEYHHWRDRIIEYPNNKQATDIIKDQIDEIESLRKNRFDEEKMSILKDRVIYNGNPLYGPSFDGDSYIKMAVSYCGDEWYLVECYYDYLFYTFLCDDLVGLEELSSELISKIEQDSIT